MEKQVGTPEMSRIDGIPGTFLDPATNAIRFRRWPELEAVVSRHWPHRVYVADVCGAQLRVITSQDPPEVGGGWRLSCSVMQPDGNCVRFPTWDEMKVARYRLIPKGVNMAIILPDDHSLYVDTMPLCLQMVECPAAWVDDNG